MTFTDVPKVGDLIYVGPDDYSSGGKAIVESVHPGISAGETVPFISVEGQPSRSMNWEFLSKRQDYNYQYYGHFTATPDGYDGKIIDGHLWLRKR